jgi:hypothetical protein
MLDLRGALAIGRQRYEEEKRARAKSKTTGSSGSSGSCDEKPPKVKGLEDAAPGTARKPVPVSPRPAINLQEEQALSISRNRWNRRTKHALEVFDVPSDPPEGFTAIQWASIRAGAEIFLTEWAACAHELGWSDADLFDLHPSGRVDRRGLAVILHAGDRVVAMDEAGADIATASGARQRYYRRAPSR